MNHSFYRVGLPALLLMPFSQALAAFDPATVGADSQWVVYADLNALRASVIGKQLVAFAEKAQADATKGVVGIDFQKLAATVGTMTAYGSNFSKDPKDLDGALIIQGTADLRKIAEAALVQATITAPERVTDITDLPFPAYAISGGNAKEAAPAQVIVAFPPEPIVLVSKSKAQVLKARDVFRGAAPSLAKASDSPLAGLLSHSGDAYLFGASVVPDSKLFATSAPQARMLQMASAGSIALGESGPLTTSHSELVATSDQMADKLMKIMQGMTAMMSLAETSDQQLTEFLNSAKVSRTGNVVAVDLAYSSARLAQMLQTLQETAPRNAQAALANAKDAAAAAQRAGMPLPPDSGTSIAQWQADSVPAATTTSGDGTQGNVTVKTYGPVTVVTSNGTANADAPAAPPPVLAAKTIENVHLVNGTTLTLAARTMGRVAPGQGASFDRVEISPSQGGGMPFIIRAEYMTLSPGFQKDRKPAGAKLIVARSPVATAQVQFQGGDGNYTLKVYYLGGANPTTTFSVSTKDPVPPPEEAPTHDDAANRGAR